MLASAFDYFLDCTIPIGLVTIGVLVSSIMSKRSIQKQKRDELLAVQ